jgi:hypothetical protein
MRISTASYAQLFLFLFLWTIQDLNQQLLNHQIHALIDCATETDVRLSLCADLDDFRHCERETATTEGCLSCCQSAHFTIPLQERECEALCPITHGKRQLNNWLREPIKHVHTMNKIQEDCCVSIGHVHRL